MGSRWSPRPCRPLAGARCESAFKEGGTRNLCVCFIGDGTLGEGVVWCSRTSPSMSRPACVGIVGPTGAGKTTLLGLLPRFYDPGEGTILLDQVDLRDYRLADLRRQFAIVLQEPVLFSTSISENIAYGRPGASFQDIAAAAKVANAHDVISALPDGYDTLVGERGMRLSGGERQRIALARAFLNDAPILNLDEPTSAVDLQTEALIMEALDRLMVGRTTFLITHRVTTLSRCDIHVELDEGRISCMRTDRPQPQRRPAATPAWPMK